MKKIFNYLLIATLLIGTAVSFSSCKDDDEDYSIVGTWKCTDTSGWYELWTFNSNGTGTYQEYYNGKVDDAEMFTYSYANNMIIENYNGETEVTTIKWVDKNHFIEDGQYHWYRQ